MMINNLEEFDKAVRRHDLTFSYSDDRYVWRKGQQSISDIITAAKKFPRENVVEIWNKWVDNKLIEPHRQAFYWK